MKREEVALNDFLEIIKEEKTFRGCTIFLNKDEVRVKQVLTEEDFNYTDFDYDKDEYDRTYGFIPEEKIEKKIEDLTCNVLGVFDHLSFDYLVDVDYKYTNDLIEHSNDNDIFYTGNVVINYSFFVKI